MRRIALAVLLLAAPLHADDSKKPDLPVSGKADEKFGPLDEFMTQFVGKQKIPGAVLAVAKDGKLVYSRGFGYSDRDAKEEMKSDTLFRVASISKPITAVAVLRLAEKGKFSLDDSVCELLSLKPAGERPDERWKKVTVRHLLEHRGGWDHSRADPMYDSVRIANAMGAKVPAMPPTVIRYMLRRPLDWNPGEKFAYCNFGYCLLGRVIEKASGDTYEAHVKKAIAEPLKLRSLRLAKTLVADRAEGETRYYSDNTGARTVMGPDFGKPCPWPYGGWCIEVMDADGGWLANAPDLVAFACAMEEPKKCELLSEKSVESLFARPEGVKENQYYAKGWQVDVSERGRTYWHSGGMEGVSGQLARRADGITFAVLFNTRDKVDGKDPLTAMGNKLNEALTGVFATK